MVRNLAYGLGLILAMLFLATKELAFINGAAAVVILSAGAASALLISTLKKKGGAVARNEDRDLRGPELVAAAQRYLLSLNEDQLLELEAFGMKGKVRGRRIFSDNVALLMVFAMFAGFMYYHHTTTVELLTKNTEAVIEASWISTLTQAEKEKLNLSMPESLRRKLRVREQP